MLGLYDSRLLTTALLTALAATALFFTLAFLAFMFLSVAISLLATLLPRTPGSARLVRIPLCFHSTFR
jgi:hypothetical protein